MRCIGNQDWLNLLACSFRCVVYLTQYNTRDYFLRSYHSLASLFPDSSSSSFASFIKLLNDSITLSSSTKSVSKLLSSRLSRSRSSWMTPTTLSSSTKSVSFCHPGCHGQGGSMGYSSIFTKVKF